MKAPPDAVVIGAGHNGLVAANVLADRGWSVLVLEAEPEPGGSVRSSEPIEPGFVNDRFSAFYPLGAASPVFRALALDIPWRHGPLVLAHPSGDGSCPVISRDVDETAASLGVDGERWHELMHAWARAEPAVLRGMTTPFPQLRAAFALGLEPSALRLLRPRLRGEHARRLLLGNALHTDIPPHSQLGRAFGLLLAASASSTASPASKVARAGSPMRSSRARSNGASRSAVVSASSVWPACAHGARSRGGGRLDTRPAARPHAANDPRSRNPQGRLDP